MTDKTLFKHIRDAAKIKEQMDALKALYEIEATKIKDEMEARHLERVETGGVKATFKAFPQQRIDTAALKKSLPEIAAAFTIESVQRRLTLA